MSDHIEFEAKSVSKAVEAACEQLGIVEKKLKYDIISYGSTGIFGLVGFKKAKIKVQLRPEKSDKVLEPPPLEPIEEGDRLDDDVENKGAPDNQPTSSQEDRLSPEIYGERVLKKVVDAITSETTIQTDKKRKEIRYDISGGNSALLIGRHGQTLEAIQYLTERIVNKYGGKRIRVSVDIEGYILKRQQKLIQYSKRLAEKAKHTGKPVTVGQMSPQDRRVIHLALREDRDVRTLSKGEGFIRKIMIFPQKLSDERRKRLASNQ